MEKKEERNSVKNIVPNYVELFKKLQRMPETIFIQDGKLLLAEQTAATFVPYLIFLYNNLFLIKTDLQAFPEWEKKQWNI